MLFGCKFSIDDEMLVHTNLIFCLCAVRPLEMSFGLLPSFSSRHLLTSLTYTLCSLCYINWIFIMWLIVVPLKRNDHISFSRLRKNTSVRRGSKRGMHVKDRGAQEEELDHMMRRGKGDSGREGGKRGGRWGDGDVSPDYNMITSQSVSLAGLIDLHLCLHDSTISQ